MSFIHNMIDYSKNSIRVRVDNILPTVSIEDRENVEQYFFLQEENASTFLDEVDTVSEKHDLTWEDALYLVAYPYADSF